MAKTQLITDMAKIEGLSEFEGDPVIAIGIEVPGLSGGLNDALRVDPVELHKGEECVLIVRGTVAKIRFEPVKDSESWQRVHILKVEEAGLVDGAVVDGLLAAQREKIEAARIDAERAQGIHRLPLADDAEEEDAEVAAERAHNQGVHSDGLRPECLLCRMEAEAEAEENGETVDAVLDRRAVQ
jgi:hypothetical protein